MNMKSELARLGEKMKNLKSLVTEINSTDLNPTQLAAVSERLRIELMQFETELAALEPKPVPFSEIVRQLNQG